MGELWRRFIKEARGVKKRKRRVNRVMIRAKSNAFRSRARRQGPVSAQQPGSPCRPRREQLAEVLLKRRRRAPRRRRRARERRRHLCAREGRGVSD